jgi:hypothetical protein
LCLFRAKVCRRLYPLMCGSLAMRRLSLSLLLIVLASVLVPLLVLLAFMASVLVSALVFP